MMKLFRPGGTISVFLVIILVPCLVVCFLFVDLSRVELSQSSVESTADTTLNSLMANYDTLLSDYYGLVASVQDIDQFYSVSEDFFKKTLVANGVSSDDSNEIVSWIFNEIRGGGEYSDLMQTSLVPGTENLYAVPKSGLGENPVLIKEGVVEFMKYRAPEYAVESIYAKLSKDGSDIQRDLENAKQDSELSDARDTFADSEGELSKKEFYTYYYYNEYKKQNLTKKDVEDAVQHANDSKQVYQDVTKDAVARLWIAETDKPMNLSHYGITCSYRTNTDGMTEYLATSTIGSYAEKKTAKDVASKVDKKEKKYYLKSKDYDDAKEDLSNKTTALKTALTDADNAVKDFVSKNYGDGSDQTNKEQWYYFAYNAIKKHIDNINKKGDAVAKAMIKVQAMQECEAYTDDTGFEADWNKTECSEVAAAKKFLKAAFVDHEGEPDSSAGKNYFIVKNEMINIWSSVNSGYSTSSASQQLNDIATKLANSREKIAVCVDILDMVINGKLGYKVVSLDKIADLADDYDENYEKWKEKAENTQTSLGKEQHNEIETQYEGKPRNVHSADVKEFKRKLSNVKTMLEKVIKGIDSIKYGGKKVAEINDFSTFYKEFKWAFDKPSSPMTNAQIEDMAKKVFEKKFTPQTGELESIISLPELSYSDYKLILTSADDKYYASLYEKYKKLKDLEKAKEGVDKEDDKLDDYEKQGDKAKEEDKAEQEGDSVSLGKDINVSDYSGTKFNDATIITSFATCIGDFINLNGRNARDSMYATLYAMNMFSYRTFVYERKASIYNGELTLKNCDGVYSDLESKWSSTDKTDTYNKTLTNRMINSTNNAANNAEIEYILYGGTNKENLKKAYLSIYALRYALNLASGFVNFYNYNAKHNSATALAINGVANAVSIATYGIIPEPVTKCVLIALVTALESAHDMKILNKGLKLKVYKMDANDWACSLSNPGTSDSTTPSTDENKVAKGDGLSMSYSDHLFVFLFSTFSSDSELSKAAYFRLGRVIEANMQLDSGEGAAFSLANAKTMFTFTAEVKVAPLMLDLSLASDYTENLSDESRWNKYTIEMTRGY